MEWISVEDELPDDHTQVLVYCVGDIIDQCECVFLEDFKRWNVSHWMYLPKSPNN